MKEVTFIGLYNEKNYGDPILAKCTEWLFCTKYIEKVTVKHLSIDIPYISLGYGLLWRIINKASRIFCKNNKKLSFIDRYNITLAKKFFIEQLADAKIAIFVGGGLIKYNVQNFSVGMMGLAEACDFLKIPVVFQSVGVEGYDSENQKCQLLKNALHKKCVRYISVRDDLDLLLTRYFDGNPQIPCVFSADSAVYASECFNIKANAKENRIGVNVARLNIFMSYGKNFDSDKLYDLYVGIIENLFKIGYQVDIYTNGAACDNVTANKLYEKFIDYGVGVKIPNSPRHLIEIISSFTAIVATRMHSCIIAYSLNVPAVGLVWNDKISMFGKLIGHEDYYFDSKSLNAYEIVNRMQETIKKGYDENIRTRLKKTTSDSIEKICSYID